MSKKIYEIITNQIVKSIQDVIDGKEKLLPWQKPWRGGKINYITGKSYRGINTFLLPEEGEYITFTQLSKLREKDPSIKLKKGCKKHMVVYWNIVKKEDEEETTYPIIRYYYVYHINDIEGVESKMKPYGHKTNEEIEQIVKGYQIRTSLPIEYINNSDRAFYSPSKDYVSMPKKEQFKDIEEFYATLFHELAHSTGHSSRLNRFSSANVSFFGSETYSKEELVAELSS